MPPHAPRPVAAPLALLAPLLATACASPGAWPDWEEEPHHLSVLLARTSEDEEAAGSVGIDYELRVSDVVGLGVVAEYAFEDLDATTLLAVTDLHVTPSFIFQTGPGVEFIEDEERFVYRFGVLYEFELGEGRTISPQIHRDFTSGEDALVVGVALGIAY